MNGLCVNSLHPYQDKFLNHFDVTVTATMLLVGGYDHLIYEDLYLVSNVKNVSVILSRVKILVFFLRGTQVVLCFSCSVHFLFSFEVTRINRVFRSN